MGPMLYQYVSHLRWLESYVMLWLSVYLGGPPGAKQPIA